MFSLNIHCEDIVLKDIKRCDLPKILEWYNCPQKYKYATGIDKRITLHDLEEKYLEAVCSGNEFFAGIYLTYHHCMIGFIKGRIKQEEISSVWINALLIDEGYKNCGYGRRSVEMIFYYFKFYHHIKNVYISVIVENIRGIKFWYKNGFKFLRKINNHIILDGKEQEIFLMKKEI
ncbi:MAG: hypothetical protein PWP27_1143 [Clostridiales bacterium]|jgi:RimJ/RimL family protein N-acetyltransferase|nr:hypothetical protein [Clostridiales bacterium]